LNGTVKVLDFGLARIVEHASVHSEESYEMSGETGSLRYMAPEGKCFSNCALLSH
jgi:serine/threonine protein kinase